MKREHQITPVTNNESPQALDLLACAYAELGRFDQALQAADQAVRLAEQHGRADWAAQFQTHRQLFLRRQPMRQQLRDDER